MMGFCFTSSLGLISTSTSCSPISGEQGPRPYRSFNLAQASSGIGSLYWNDLSRSDMLRLWKIESPPNGSTENRPVIGEIRSVGID